MDPTDAQVLRRLQRDVRRPYAEIAAELGLAADDVEARVARLVGTGVVTLTAVTDPLSLGFAREALLGLTVEPGRVEEVVAALAALPQVHYLVRTDGGDVDLLCEVTGVSDVHLLEVLSHQVQPLPGVLRVQTHLYLRTEKMSFDWDPTWDPT